MKILAMYGKDGDILSYTAFLIVCVVICVIVGFILGIAVSAMITAKRICGNLVVDNTNEDGTYFFLELEKKPEKITESKYTTLRIVKRGYFDS